jgi:uncharacterized protein YbaA (DUF1428 family)
LAASCPGVFIYDVDIEPFMSNRAFDREAMRRFPGADAVVALGDVLRDRGLQTVTADVYLGGPLSSTPAVCLSNHLTAFTPRLAALGHVEMVACMTLESPLGALDFFQRIEEASRVFEHVFFWKGTRERATGGARFHEVHWPYPRLSPEPNSVAWDSRKFLVLVNSNKRVFAPPRPLFDVRHPRHSVRRLLDANRRRRLRNREPWFQSELYEDRLEAVRHFAAAADFDLFGFGWGDTSQLTRPYAEAVEASYRGEIGPYEKVATMAGYQFSLCFENTAMLGYITEKIFDCLVSGCIPVYLGAPDIEESVPLEAFVDARRFADWDALEAALRAMTPEMAAAKLDAARDFMSSPAAVPFTQRHFVDEMAATLCADEDAQTT